MSAKDFQPKPETPVKKYWKYKAGSGEFTRWDKEKSTNFTTDSLTFILLEQCSFISGFYSKSEKGVGIISNFVLNTKEQDLNVKTFDGLEIAKGKYQEIKDTVKANGGKYTKGYFIYNLASKEIEHIAFSGAGLGDPTTPAKERVKIKNAFKYKVEKGVLTKNKASKFYYPVWSPILDIGIEEFDIAQAKAKVIDDYIADYFGRAKTIEEPKEELETHFESEDSPIITDEEFAEIQTQMPF
jgi:hypothetical protein